MQQIKRLYQNFALPWIVVSMGVFLSVFVTWKSVEWIEKIERMRFETASEQITFLVQKKIDMHTQLLFSAVSFMDASDNVTSKEWKMFAEKNYIAERFPGLQTLGYASRTSEGFILQYIEPLSEHNKILVGYNIAIETNRKNTIDQAIYNGTVAISSKIELIQETKPDEKPGFLIYAPYFAKNAPIDTHEERINATRGIVSIAIKAKTLFRDLLGVNYITVDFEVYDGIGTGKVNQLYDSNSALTSPRLERYTTFEFYGKKWTIYFKANQVLDMGANRYIPYVGLFFGLSLSLVLGGWIYALQRTRKEAYRLADEKTKQLLTSEAEIRTVFQAMQEGVIVQNAEGVITESNLAAQEIFGIDLEVVPGARDVELKWQAIDKDGTIFPPKERPIAKVFETGEIQENIGMGIKRTDGSIVWVYVNAQPIFSDDFKKVVSVVATFRDFTTYRHSKQELDRYLNIIDTHVAISSTDCKGVITKVSEAFCKICGYTKEELIGKRHKIVRHPDIPSSLYEAMWKSLKKGIPWKGEIKNKDKNGSSYWVDVVIAPLHDELHEMIGYTAIYQDITDKKRVEELSITDRLTGLYNRLKLDELFALHLSLTKRHGSSFSVIMADIDKFKLVNDTFGHQVGDKVLQELSFILRNNIRLEDAVGRWGGEEFLILLPETSLESAMVLAEMLRERTEKFSFTTVGTKTISLGVATFHQGDDEISIVGRADEALYRAKANGRNRVESEIYQGNLP